VSTLLPTLRYARRRSSWPKNFSQNARRYARQRKKCLCRRSFKEIPPRRSHTGLSAADTAARSPSRQNAAVVGRHPHECGDACTENEPVTLRLLAPLSGSHMTVSHGRWIGMSDRWKKDSIKQDCPAVLTRQHFSDVPHCSVTLPGSAAALRVRSEVNNSLIIVNFFHKIQNFRQISDLFSQIWLKKRHTSLFSGIWREIRKKIHQKFAEKMQNSKCLRLN